MNAYSIDSQSRIAIVGGGTAGHLAALTLRALYPHLDITLIESKKHPIIGVGEATTSEIVPFLHVVLGFDMAEFYHEVQPTWKLGIKFLWGPEETPFFNYPFDRGPILESYLFEGHSRNSSLLSALMAADRAPVVAVNGSPSSLLSKVPFAYHLDNRRFVRYLQRKSVERGIRHLDYEVADAVLHPDGKLIDHLVSSDGVPLKYDFYVDCTGFRSLLLEQRLNSNFRSYASSLLTDSAIVANTPHCGTIKPYTTAETMDHGWCWNIPQRDEDHLGYVFSSAFCSPDEAITEFRQKHPEIHDVRRVNFRSGRHEDFVKGNVAAIGNSYGFVEPLESTGIFAICRQCLLLAHHLYDLESDPSALRFVNSTVARMWDYLRWFLAIHYRFNTRRQTAFWRRCRTGVDVSGAGGVLARFKTDAPLSYYGLDDGPGGGHNFNAYGYDVMLFGQAVAAKRTAPRQSRKEYFRHVEQIQSMAGSALDQASALHLLHNRPEFHADLLQAGGWVSELATNMYKACLDRADDADLTAEGCGEKPPIVPVLTMAPTSTM